MTTYNGNENDNTINGSNGDDFIYGHGGDDRLSGKKGDDHIFGGSGNDEINGDQGNDHLTGGAGLDFLDGGDGFDTAYYSGSILEYDFYNLFGMLAIVHDNGNGADGADLLVSIERLVFADAVIDLGVNNAPIAFDDSASLDEDVGTYSSGTASVVDNDFDFEGNALTVTPGMFAGTYGTLTLNADGTYAYTPFASTQSLAAGESVQDSFSYTVSDGSLTDTGTLTFTIGGLNDAPTIDAGGTTATGSVTELANGDPDENAFTHQSSGTVAFDDVDLSDTHGASFTPQGGGYLGTFTLDPVNQAGDSVGWDFSVEDSDIDFLAEGEVLVQTYQIEISDGNGGFVTQDVTITITGESDNLPPDAVDDTYDATGNVTLNVDAAGGVLANDSDDAGVGTGPGETPVTAYDSSSANGGTVTMNPDGSFSYTSAPGFTGTDTFTYTITDAEGEVDTATVSINVAGSVWFIDNSAVGSADLGTQADPYTSIASFNAAQGTANGPAAGETVYLREGLGTYAEADGINLLDGQVLVGGGQDLIVGGDTIEAGTGRPTIVTIGAGNHGVELAQDNTVSGFDIGATTGAGISDGSGTVGTLTVSDVGVSGTGQIVDIDQGGTVSVTLNGAASTASSGGAIDLNGLSGSFAVTGATTIAGLHGGGGVDVTASSLAVTFAGGGLVSTGAATGISFTGNSGSLSITGGGFEVATTGGVALNVQDGGTVSISGSGNNIASTTGSAVIIRNASSNGVTLESVSSAGGNDAGIILDNAGSGGFTVTGIGSVAGSGGTISGKNGADGSLVQGIGVAITGTANVSLSNMAIAGTQNFGILGSNVDNFTLRDSSVTGTHGTNLALNESAVSFTGLSGTVLLEGNDIEGGRADNLRIVNSSGSLDLTIADSAGDAAGFGHNHVDGSDSVFIETGGTASLTLTVDGVEFQGARSDLLHVSATGSSTQDVEILNSTFHNEHANIVSGGGGIILSGSGAGADIDVDYLVQGNSFRGASGNAISANYTIPNGTIQGRIEGNVIGLDDGLEGDHGSSGGGAAISAGLSQTSATGDTSHAVAIVGNEIYDIAQGIGGIHLSVSGGDAANGAVMEAQIDGNIIEDSGDFTFASLYAVVGGSASSGDFSQLGLDITDNLFDHGGADFGGNALFLDQVSIDSHYYFPGYGGSSEGEFNGGTAGADLDVFLTGQGNVFVNGVFASWPGGVDASFVTGVTGDPLVLAPWLP